MSASLAAVPAVYTPACRSRPPTETTGLSRRGCDAQGASERGCWSGGGDVLTDRIATGDGSQTGGRDRPRFFTLILLSFEVAVPDQTLLSSISCVAPWRTREITV